TRHHIRLVWSAPSAATNPTPCHPEPPCGEACPPQAGICFRFSSFTRHSSLTTASLRLGRSILNRLRQHRAQLPRHIACNFLRLVAQRGLLIPERRLLVPKSRLLIAELRLHVARLRLQVPQPALQVPDLRLQIAKLRLRPAL